MGKYLDPFLKDSTIISSISYESTGDQHSKQQKKQKFVILERPNEIAFVPLIELLDGQFLPDSKYLLHLKNASSASSQSPLILKLLEDENKIFSVRYQFIKQQTDLTYSIILSTESNGIPANGYYILQIFDVSITIFLENTITTKIPSSSKPQQQQLFPTEFNMEWYPDGPQFRSKIKQMESLIVERQRPFWKSLNESILKLSTNLRQVSIDWSQLINLLTNSKNCFLPGSPLLPLIHEQWSLWSQENQSRTLALIKGLEKNISPLLQSMIKDALNSKNLVSMQRTYNDSVKSYYQIMNDKVKDQRTNTNDSLPLKIKFDLARWNYYQFLYQLNYTGLPLRNFYISLTSLINPSFPSSSSPFISQYHKSYIPTVNQFTLAISKCKTFNELNATYSATTETLQQQQQQLTLMTTVASRKEGLLWIKESEFNQNTNSSHNKKSNVWHKNWVILNENKLTLQPNWKQQQQEQSLSSSSSNVTSNLRTITINLTFACIKKINSTTFQIIESTTASLIDKNNHTNKSRHQQLQQQLYELRAGNEEDLNDWLTALNESNHNNLTSTPISSSLSKTLPNNIHSEESSNLLTKVKSLHPSNQRCCDCNTSDGTVEWISLNLLCLVCIKCSGVHRSMGAHISKIRSLTLDNFTSKEMIYLIKNYISNEKVNSIYESGTNNTQTRISSNATDSRRSQYINDKYRFKKFINPVQLQDESQSLKSLINGIHNESIHTLQKVIAESKLSMRELSINHKNLTLNHSSHTTLFQYSLKHHIEVNDQPLFIITEFLLNNGLIVDRLPHETEKWPKPAIKYWKSILGMYEPYEQPRSPSASSSSFSPNLQSQLNSSRSTPLQNKPSSASSSSSRGLISSGNFLSLHKSLKLNKRK